MTATIGRAYSPPVTGQRAIALTNALLVLEGGHLQGKFTNDLVLTSANRGTNTNRGKLSLSITPSSGLLAGTFTQPDSNRSVRFKGALLQDINLACGFFIDTNLSGRVSLFPTP
jgi:hypothetical protein